MDEANKIDDFRCEWLRQHRAHSDWQAIIKPCYDNMTCGKVKRGWEKANRTNSISLLSNDEVKDAHSDFDRCPRGGGLRPKFLSISIFLGHTLRSKITASWNMSQHKNSLSISLETSVFCRISKSASLWLCSWQADWTRPRKRLGYDFNFLSTASGTIDQCTMLTSSPETPRLNLWSWSTNKTARWN